PRPGGRSSQRARSAPAPARLASEVPVLPAASSPPRSPARSHGAPAPAAARAAPRARRGGRRPAPSSLLAHEPEAARLVANLPAELVDLRAEPVGLFPVMRHACGLAPPGQLADLA